MKYKEFETAIENYKNYIDNLNKRHNDEAAKDRIKVTELTNEIIKLRADTLAAAAKITERDKENGVLGQKLKSCMTAYKEIMKRLSEANSEKIGRASCRERV